MPERGCQTTRPGVSVVFVISNCNNLEAEEIPFRARKPHPCRLRSVAPIGNTPMDHTPIHIPLLLLPK